jgi:hypothetical protein
MDKNQKIVVAVALVCMALVVLVTPIQKDFRISPKSSLDTLEVRLWLSVVFFGGAAYMVYRLIIDKGKKE